MKLIRQELKLWQHNVNSYKLKASKHAEKFIKLMEKKKLTESELGEIIGQFGKFLRFIFIQKYYNLLI